MKNLLYILKVILLYFISLASFSCKNYRDEVTITVRQFQVPVLKNRENNPVLQIKISVPDSDKNLNVRRFRITSSGCDNHEDIENVQILFTGVDSLWPGNNTVKGIFGKAEKISRVLNFKGEQTLSTGDNYFWVVCNLNQSASLHNRIDFGFSSVRVTGCRKMEVIEINTGIRQRVGVAVRKHLDDNVHTYRIPGLATTKAGTLLAIYDVRRLSSRDLQGDIDIGLSRSTDGGNTWEPMRIVLDMDEWGGLPQKFNGVSDACILVDENSGKIFVAGLWMHGVLDTAGRWIEGLTEESNAWEHQWRRKGSQPGFDVRQTSQFLITTSTDDGKTWSEPENLTRMCKRREWWLLAPAPGRGITMDDGTLVFPAQGRDENGVPFSNIIYSLDGGLTWKTSNPAFSGTNECAVVQLDDGTLMLNMRYGQRQKGETGRAVAVTSDLGKTWREHTSSRNTLREPVCMASLLKHEYSLNGEKKHVLVFSNPDVESPPRRNITIKVSFDDGLTWPEEYYFLLDEGTGRGYSCLTSVDERTIGILYESSQADLVFESIPLEELLKINK
ncbi:MAG TPA: exo-alpha-sialidase [Bacteroidales bacterium]|nr:exo-alpha-sialidase [Bacteroidales bacterium]